MSYDFISKVCNVTIVLFLNHAFVLKVVDLLNLEETVHFKNMRIMLLHFLFLLALSIIKYN